MDGVKCGIFEDLQPDKDRRGKTLDAIYLLSRRRSGQNSICGGNGVRAMGKVIATLASVSLCRILERPQVIADRYYREEDDNEHDQCNQLRAPVNTSTRLRPEPKTDDSNCNQCPAEIEE